MKVVALRALLRGFALIPPRWGGALAHPTAAALWSLSPRLREVSLVNLRLCYPNMEESERRHLARQAMVHYVRNVMDGALNWSWPLERLRRRFDPPVGTEHLENAVRAGRGVIMLLPHFGPWEFASSMLAETIDGRILYKPGGDAALEALVLENRQRHGVRMAPADRRGLRALLHDLAEGRTVAMLPDQEPMAGEGRFVPFFGVPALTGVLAPRLLQRTGAKALFMVVLRLPKGRYRIHFLPAADEVYSDDVDVACAAINEGVERCVALDPPQYLWAYRRFRNRPQGGDRRYWRKSRPTTSTARRDDGMAPTAPTVD